MDGELAALDTLGVASYIYVNYGSDQLSLVRLLCSFPFVIESLRERTLSRLLKMPFCRWQSVLRKKHDLHLNGLTKDGATRTEVRRGDRALLSLEDDQFGSVMAALRNRLVQHADIDAGRFHLTALCTNGRVAHAQIDSIWNDAGFAKYEQHLLPTRGLPVADFHVQRWRRSQ